MILGYKGLNPHAKHGTIRKYHTFRYEHKSGMNIFYMEAK